MSVTVSGPLTIGPTVVALVHVLPPAGLGAPGLLAPRTGPRSRRSPRRCRAPISTSSYFFCSRALVALGADHEPVLAGQDVALVVPEHLRRSTRARPARRTRSACRARPTRALRRHTRRSGAQRRPPLPGAGRVEGVHAPERVALHELAVLGRHLGAPRPHRSACPRRPAAAGRWARPSGSPPRTPGRTTAGCRRRRPRRRGGRRRCPGRTVVGRQRVGLGDADPPPQPGDAFVGDRSVRHFRPAPPAARDCCPRTQPPGRPSPRAESSVLHTIEPAFNGGRAERPGPPSRAATGGGSAPGRPSRPRGRPRPRSGPAETRPLSRRANTSGSPSHRTPSRWPRAKTSEWMAIASSTRSTGRGPPGSPRWRHAGPGRAQVEAAEVRVFVETPTSKSTRRWSCSARSPPSSTTARMAGRYSSPRRRKTWRYRSSLFSKNESPAHRDSASSATSRRVVS